MNSTQIEQHYKSAMFALENKDEKTFVRLMNIACENNHVDALLQLGFFYRDNVPNPQKMIECWAKASDLGSSDASYNLGREYWRRKDYVQMKKYYDDCCSNGDYDGAYQLACYYRDIDNKKLMEEYINLGIANNNKLCHDLSNSQKLDHVYYRQGVANDKKGYLLEAIKYYKQSINACETDACETDACETDACETNACETDACETTAHTKSSIASMFNLGLLYKNSNNSALSIKYFLMACKNGSLEAPLLVAQYYEDIKDYSNMKRYLLIGIDRDCTKCLDRMIKHSALTKNEEDIIKYTQMSADSGDAESIEFMKDIDYSLGMLYEYLKDIDNMKRSLDNGIKKKCIKCCKAMLDYMRRTKDIKNIIKYDAILFELKGKLASDKEEIDIRKAYNESFGPPDEAKESGWTDYKDMQFCVQLDFIQNKLEKVVNHIIKETKDKGWILMSSTLIMTNITEQQSCITFKNKDYVIGSRVVFRKKGTRGIYTSFSSRHIAELILNKYDKKSYMINFYSDDWENALIKAPVCVIYSIDNILNSLKSEDLETLEKIKRDYSLLIAPRDKINIYDLDFFKLCMCNLTRTIIKCLQDGIEFYFIIYHKNELHKNQQIKNIIGQRAITVVDPKMFE